MTAKVPSYYRETPQRYRYEGNSCKECGKVFFPPRIACDPFCTCTLKPHKLALAGKVKTYTIIHIAPPGFGDEAPYALAVVELNDGARITAQIADVPLDKVRVGLRVRIEFRLIQKDGHAGILQYGYKVVPE